MFGGMFFVQLRIAEDLLKLGKIVETRVKGDE
jgi:hypothetical protein